MKQENKKSIYEVVKTYELDPIVIDKSGEIEHIRFRIEVLKQYSAEIFTARVLRIETYKLRPSFQKNRRREVFDEVISIYDDGNEWECVKGKTKKDVLIKILDKINKIFGAAADFSL